MSSFGTTCVETFELQDTSNWMNTRPTPAFSSLVASTICSGDSRFDAETDVPPELAAELLAEVGGIVAEIGRA